MGMTVVFDLNIKETFKGDINKQELCFSLYNSSNFEKSISNNVITKNILHKFSYYGFN